MDMSCVQVTEVGTFQLTRLPVQLPNADEVLIKAAVTGLCRTDFKLIRVGHRDLVLSRVPGEEVVGEIADKGARVAGVERGDLVYVYPGVWCGACPACRSGAENLCRDMRIMDPPVGTAFRHQPLLFTSLRGLLREGIAISP